MATRNIAALESTLREGQAGDKSHGFHIGMGGMHLKCGNDLYSAVSRTVYKITQICTDWY